MTPPSTSAVVGDLKTRTRPSPAATHRSVKVPPTSVPMKNAISPLSRLAAPLRRFRLDCCRLAPVPAALVRQRRDRRLRLAGREPLEDVLGPAFLQPRAADQPV